MPTCYILLQSLFSNERKRLKIFNWSVPGAMGRQWQPFVFRARLEACIISVNCGRHSSLCFYEPVVRLLGLGLVSFPDHCMQCTLIHVLLVPGKQTKIGKLGSHQSCTAAFAVRLNC